MKRNKVLMALFAILIIASMLLAGCNQATEAPAETTETVAETAAPVEGAAVPVEIVLPTKNEPRWLQDEARFKEALTKAGLPGRDPVQPRQLRQGKVQCRDLADQGR